MGQAQMQKSTRKTNQKVIALWLVACAVMVFLMVVVGGLTRLTESGLSIVEWKPVLGALPPLTEEEWKAEFTKYKNSPEFIHKNFTMNVDEFKGIFWLEYLHRLLGRIVGFVFFVPYFSFLIRRQFSSKQALTYAGIFILGGLQGVLGWYMVKSGLVQDPRVSPYRLMLHLGLAFIIFGALWLEALKILQKEPKKRKVKKSVIRRHQKVFIAISALIFVQVLLGALVAGNDAGLVYNTFPSMNGQVIPDGLFAREPVAANFTQNPTLVQFNHRLGAYIVVLAVTFGWRCLQETAYPKKIKKASNVMIFIIIIQFFLGVATLLMQVPISLASLHQAVALILFAVSLFINQRLYVMFRAVKTK